MYKSLHPYKGEGWRVRRIAKSSKVGRENLHSNEKATGEIALGEKVKQMKYSANDRERIKPTDKKAIQSI